MSSDIQENLKELLLQALKSNDWDGVYDGIIEIMIPPQESMGDYTTNIALVLASKLKKNPLEIAESIASKIVEDETVEKIEVVRPGYVNFYLQKNLLQDIVSEIIYKKSEFGKNVFGEEKKVLVEFISANPTGPIHLGNGRGGPAGDTLARVLEKSGYEVSREFYINDFGNQIEMLGHSVLQDKEAQYRGEYIDTLAENRPQEMIDPMEVGEWAAKQIIETMNKPTCEKLGIHFQKWFSEKSLHTKNLVAEMLDILERKNLVYGSEGAKWFRSTEFGDDKDRVIMRSNGKNTYLLADFAYHKNKVDRGFDKLITFLGADHHGEAKVMRSFVSEVLGYKDMLDILLTQIVRVMKDGEEVKMSKRNGTYYAIDDLIAEVGRDAVRFIFTSYANSSHINFDIDVALEQSDKNPVYYVQYAHARLCSILKKAEAEGMQPSSKHISLLTHQKELSLLREVAKFPGLIERIATSYETHLLPRYTMDLADKLHSFYGTCQVIDTENRRLSEARLALVESTKIVLAEALRLIGISAPEKM